jgi:hypothetical protein
MGIASLTAITGLTRKAHELPIWRFDQTGPCSCASGPTLRNHASQIWTCDSLRAYDAFLRKTFVYVADASSSGCAHDVWPVLAS